MQLSYSDEPFNVHIMSFGIFFTSDEKQAAKEIYRTIKKGGIAMLTCWKESTLFEMIFDVQRIFQPVSPIKDLPMRENL